jgi:hypothetical protein
MAGHSLNLTGKKIGKLTVIEMAPRSEDSGDRSNYWKSICECGNTHIARASWLNRCANRVEPISCGCELKFTFSRRRTKTEDDFVAASIKTIIKNYKQSAKRKSYSFLLSKEEFTKFITSPCHYCGALETNTHCVKNLTVNREFHYNGIDRMDNSKGYCLENCVTACMFCNYAKRTQSYDDFIVWINNLVKHKNALLTSNEKPTT